MKTKLFLHKLDQVNLFKKNLPLKFNNPDRISSVLGTFLSVCIIIFLLYNFFFSDMVQNTNPTVLFQSIETKLRPGIKLDQNNFVLAFGLIDSDNSIYPQDPTIFNFGGYLMDCQIKNRSCNETFLNTSFCTQEMFSRFPNEYLNLGLSNVSCINSDEANKLFIKGWWDENELSYFYMSLNKCKNETNSSIVCQSPEVIEEFFKDKLFSYWVEQKNIDISNYENPISAKIKNFYHLIKTNEYREINFFLKKTIIKTDDAPIYSNEHILESYQHEGLDKDSFSPYEENLFNLYFYSGPSTQTFQRNYQKLFDLIANIGGILGASTTIFSILINMIFEWKVNEYILNKLYFLNDQFVDLSRSQKKSISISALSSSLSKISKEKKKKKFFSRLCESIKLLFISKISQSNSDKFASNKEEKKKLNFSFWEWIKFFFRKKRNRTKKESVYLNYIKIIDEKLDLIQILKKLEEIDKMKFVIFNEDQLSLFNSLSKKYINFSDNKDGKENIFQYHKKRNKSSLSQISKIRSQFQKIDGIRENIDPIDKRLMQIFSDFNDLK